MLSTDKRWKQVGEVLINQCLKVKPGERVYIAQHEPETWSLALATYEAAIKAGGYPQIQMKSEYLRRAFMKYGTEAQYSWAPELEIKGTEWADCYAALRGGYNLDLFHDIPADVLAKNQLAQGVVSTARWKNTRWVLSRVPNEAFAQQAGLDLETITDLYFNASLLDYDAYTKKWNNWTAKLAGTSEAHVIGKNTDLRLSFKGRTWDTVVATINVPGGETYTAPILETVNGHIWFENPGVLGGKLMHDLYLEWKDGELIKASASTNEDYLHNIVKTDPGASKIGEFAIGLNDKLTLFTNDILWDENIMGTMHIALGRAYKNVGGTNESAIHWDIVKDLRKEGEFIIDGKPIIKDGKLLFDTF
jgi:aminopeptidase